MGEANKKKEAHVEELLMQANILTLYGAEEITDIPEGAVMTYVDADLTEYRRKYDRKTVKKNCTIPSYLSYEAEKAGINFSRLLQEALIDRLGLRENA